MKVNLLLIPVIVLLWACDPDDIKDGTTDEVPVDSLGNEDSTATDTTDSDTTQVPDDTIMIPEDTVFGPPEELVIIEGAIHFYVFGDFGRRGEFGQRELGRMMDTVSTALPPDFVVGTGDNFYPDGVSGMSDSHWRESFEEVYPKDNGLDCPWYMTLGNHDYHIDPKHQIDYMEISDRWIMKDNFYHEDFKKGDISIRMVFLDTNPYIDELYTQGKFKNKIILQDTAYRMSWMDSLFSDDSKTWKIAVGHHPVYSGGNDGSEIRSMKNHVEPHLESSEVDVYFNGHVHMIYHAISDGTHYFTSGCGSKTETGSDIPEMLFSSSSSAFVIASATPDSIYCQVVNHRGEIEYRASVK